MSLYTCILQIDVHFVEKHDPYVNPLSVKIGEISIAGVAAAIANAIYHVTGKPICDLLITPNKLL